jgi:hypothetical protein
VSQARDGKGDNLAGTMLEELKLSQIWSRPVQAFQMCVPGKNGAYDLPDVGMSAFSVFFTQSPSFLAHQRGIKLRKGRITPVKPGGNAESLFNWGEIPAKTRYGICWILSIRFGNLI